MSGKAEHTWWAGKETALRNETLTLAISRYLNATMAANLLNLVKLPEKIADIQSGATVDWSPLGDIFVK